ncbi:MAG: acyl-CoA dehydratase activase [Thermodesulfobacteriota bacterium]
MMVGIDLGSRTVKVAAVENGELRAFRIEESTFDLERQARRLVEPFRPRRVVATGYGRHLARRHFADEVITEIKAHAIGARRCFPGCTTILDVGGQDAKVIRLDGQGCIDNFQMNDKCAAGTGRFLEIMAGGLGLSLAEFGPLALASTRELAISSMCTVFAESEVISLKHAGHPPADVARAVHLSVVDRLASMLARAGHGDNIVFTGGVARNQAMVRLLAEKLGVSILVADTPDIVGALGAALHGETHGRA